MPNEKDNSKNMASLFGAVSPILGAGLSYLGQMRTNDANLALNRQNNIANAMNAAAADARNMQLWNMTNEYNSPLNQRRRLEEAGLNPGLMYGGIENTAGMPADSNVPESSAGQREFNGNAMASAFSQMGQMITDNSGLNARIKEAQAESIELDNEIKAERRPQELKNLELAGQLLAQDLQDKKDESKRATEKHDKEMKKADEDLRKAISDADMSEAQYNEFMKFEPIRERKAELENDLLSSRIAGQNLQNRITKMQADQAAKEIAVIEELNYTMAEDQFLIDNFFNDYLTNNKEYKFVFWEMRWKDDGYAKSTITNPQAWVSALSQAQRFELLQKGNWFKDKKYLNKQYQNLYYKKSAKSNLSPITQEYFNVSNQYSDGETNLPLKLGK